MDLKKYFNPNYIQGKVDCWTLLQDIFKDEHNIDLPNYPYAIEGRENEFEQHARANLKLETVQKPEKGCIVYVGGRLSHVGYALNSKMFIHQTVGGTKVERIKKEHILYKVMV